MVRYFVQRLVYVALILAALTVVIFLITQALPGNAARMILGSFQSEEALRALEQKLGLDQPLVVQYWNWVSHFVRGDMGESLVMNRPVAPVVFNALGSTLLLALPAMAVVILFGIGFGVLGGVKRDSRLDHALSVVSFAGISLPEFFWGIVLIMLFAGYFKLLPSSGKGEFGQDPIGAIKFLVLPVMTLAFTLVAHVARQTRSSMIDVLQSNYIRAARARGLPERLIILRHALRNALLPTITVLALDFGFLVGEIVVVESVFAYPGFGRLTVFAVQQRDLPLIQACVLILAAIYTLMTLVADMLYAYFNPRIRYGAASEV